MLRTPRSLKVHAIVDPTGDATRFSGDGKLRICSTVNGRDAVCCAINMKANAKIRRRCIVMPIFQPLPRMPEACWDISQAYAFFAYTWTVPKPGADVGR